MAGRGDDRPYRRAVHERERHATRGGGEEVGGGSNTRDRESLARGVRANGDVAFRVYAGERRGLANPRGGRNRSESDIPAPLRASATASRPREREQDYDELPSSSEELPPCDSCPIHASPDTQSSLAKALAESKQRSAGNEQKAKSHGWLPHEELDEEDFDEDEEELGGVGGASGSGRHHHVSDRDDSPNGTRKRTRAAGDDGRGKRSAAPSPESSALARKAVPVISGGKKGKPSPSSFDDPTTSKSDQEDWQEDSEPDSQGLGRGGVYRRGRRHVPRRRRPLPPEFDPVEEEEEEENASEITRALDVLRWELYANQMHNKGGSADLTEGHTPRAEARGKDLLRDLLTKDMDDEDETSDSSWKPTPTPSPPPATPRAQESHKPAEDSAALSANAFDFTKKSKKAVYTLASLAKSPECVEHIVRNDGIALLIETVRRCVNTKNVSVSRAHNLRAHPKAGAGASSASAGKSSIHKTAEYILKNTCLVIGFVATNVVYRRRVIEEGGVWALVNVLRCYSALCVQSQRGMSAAVVPALHLQQNPGEASRAKGDRRLRLVKDSHASGGVGSKGMDDAWHKVDAKIAEMRGEGSTPIYTIARRAAGALANLAHEDVRTKNLVREEGGIPALVLLLKAREFSVQVAAASTLKAIAFRNEDNKNQIVECGALSSLVCMLCSGDPSIHYEAVAVMSSLVHSSAHIKKLVLNGGALQPLINLLSSTDMESRREAALLLGQFANVQDPDYKSKIVQRGALGPLIAMLLEESVQVREMAAFAVGRLAQNVDNQAGIVQAGGLQPLISLLGSKYLNSQHNAAFALYGLSDNDDNVPYFLKSGCVSLLLNGKFHVQASKDCVRNTLKKLEEKIAQAHVLHHLKYLLSSEASDLATKYYIATGLAFLAPQAALYNVFMENRGMDVLFFHALNSGCSHCQKESIDAIHSLGKRSKAFAKLPTIEHGVKPGVYEAPPSASFLGGHYLDCDKFSDVTFVVENRRIKAHKIALLAASHKAVEILGEDSSVIVIKDVGFQTWMTVLQFIYSGKVHITENDNTHELLVQAERLQLDGLKYACETFLISTIDAQSVAMIYDLATECNTCYLHKAAVWYTISEYSRLVKVLGQATVSTMLTKMFDTFIASLTFK